MTWSVDDVVEVLHDGYWKVSLIVGVSGEDCYQIQVVGSIDEFRVSKSSIRVRQIWKENEWMLMEKVSGDCEDLVSRMRRRIHMLQQQEQQKQCDYKWQLVPDSSYISKLMKGPLSDSRRHSEDNSERAKKRRAISKEVDLHAIIDDSNYFVGKPCGGASCMNHDGEKLLARAIKPSECVSKISSVGSCSITNAISNSRLNNSSAGCGKDNDCLCSDAESLKTFGYVKGPSVVSRVKQVVRPHDLDLRSYRYFLKTLYASGPLTWDQELLLTNLRKTFCVSNDEHLTELRRLRCGGGLSLRCR
ncbi:hypothetical protein RND81_10G087300 [Saponaria officinalis]|uniref:ENT domain-containing protein n=1 Tax=Saponaria officinalis TaxID=3572 RepID=A0AAW1I232_SAPOF